MKKHSIKKRKSAKSMLIKGFLRSFFIVAILLGAAVAGYQATLKIWAVEGNKDPIMVTATPSPEPITTPSVDDISKNLIYCYDKEDNRISRILLEIFNCDERQLAYITIPISTKLTMSDTLYRKLKVIRPEIPQIIRLSAITKYLSEDTVFDYGVLMVEDLLGTKLSYYTVIPEDLFTEMFEEQEQPIPTQVFTKAYTEKIGKLNTEEEINAYLEEIYPRISSNLSLQDKLNYVESYLRTPIDRVIFMRLAGEELNSGFEMDTLKAALQIHELSASKPSAANK